MSRLPICLLMLACGAAQAGGTLFAGAGSRSGGSAERQPGGNITLHPENTQSVSLGSATSGELLLDLAINADSAYQLWVSHSRHSLQPLSSGEMRVSHAQIGGINFYPDASSGLRPFVAGGIGASQIEVEDLPARLYPSFSLAGGLDIPLGKLLTARLEARISAVAVTSEYRIYCSGGCSAQINAGLWTQWGGSALLGFRF